MRRPTIVVLNVLALILGGLAWCTFGLDYERYLDRLLFDYAHAVARQEVPEPVGPTVSRAQLARIAEDFEHHGLLDRSLLFACRIDGSEAARREMQTAIDRAAAHRGMHAELLVRLNAWRMPTLLRRRANLDQMSAAGRLSESQRAALRSICDEHRSAIAHHVVALDSLLIPVRIDHALEALALDAANGGIATQAALDEWVLGWTSDHVREADAWQSFGCSVTATVEPREVRTTLDACGEEPTGLELTGTTVVVRDGRRYRGRDPNVHEELAGLIERAAIDGALPDEDRIRPWLRAARDRAGCEFRYDRSRYDDEALLVEQCETATHTRIIRAH